MSKYNVKKFVLDKKGVGELLKSAEALELVTGYANEIASRCGEGYVVTQYPNGKTRVNASVITDTEEAMQDNYDNNTLLKAVR